MEKPTIDPDNIKNFIFGSLAFILAFVFKDNPDDMRMLFIISIVFLSQLRVNR